MKLLTMIDNAQNTHTHTHTHTKVKAKFLAALTRLHYLANPGCLFTQLAQWACVCNLLEPG